MGGALNPVAVTDQIADQHGLVKNEIPTSHFRLLSYSRILKPGQPLTVYIEGDGLAWLSKHVLSDDPTPRHPLVLTLACMDSSPNLLYLARPCQYVFDAKCDPSYWSDKRFSEEVVTSMDEAIDFFMKKTDTSRLRLVGYSGGGAVALLIAERRSDVASLRTIAGNLNPAAVNRYHEVTPLAGSLDPAAGLSLITKLPQRHFVGDQDKMVPPFIARDFVKQFPKASCAEVEELPGVTHYQGWQKVWAGLSAEAVPCEENQSKT